MYGTSVNSQRHGGEFRQPLPTRETLAICRNGSRHFSVLFNTPVGDGTDAGRFCEEEHCEEGLGDAGPGGAVFLCFCISVFQWERIGDLQ